jgi:nucleotide-binding universal stress UspA family protein
MKTIICGVDGSPGARVGLRVAASLATELDARLVAVHVLDRVIDVGPNAERAAANVLYDEMPDAAAESRGEVGDVAERLAAVAHEEDAMMIVLGARSRGRSRTFLRARCAAELAELTSAPVLIAPPQLAAARETTLNPATIKCHNPMSRAAASAGCGVFATRSHIGKNSIPNLAQSPRACTWIGKGR